MKRVLIATDGSAAADEAVELGVELARDEGAEVIFVHVVPYSDIVSMNGFGLMGTCPTSRPSGTRNCSKRRRQRPSARTCPLEPRCYVANPSVEIVRHADAIDADLIVLGSRGHGAIASALLGSVSRGILGATRRPVLIVRSSKVREPAAL